jgi:aspartyl-tRNA synthetase
MWFPVASIAIRDEDLRPNRQPEFTQLDLEASFIDEAFIFETIEELTCQMFLLGGIALPRPFFQMTYQEAINRYGTDRPDTRFGMAFEDVSDVLRETSYSIFRQIIAQGGRIKGFCVKGQASALSKNVLQNEYALRIVPELGGKGMSWMKVTDGRLQSNIVQFFGRRELEGLRERFQADEGDVLMMIADASLDQVNKVLCSLRLHVANRLNVASDSEFRPLWVTEFPLFELKDERLSSQHHPFTMPDRVDFDPSDQADMLGLNSRAYDLVVNGEELGGGSIRIHQMEIQRKIFHALGLSAEDAEAKFGFFLKALEYGAPPHGGLALGIDRVIAMILGVSSIRDVIAFPKNRSAFCPLTRAPASIDREQRAELGLGAGVPTRTPSLEPPAGIGEQGDRFSGRERISQSEVAHVAKLARLKLSESEAADYQKDLNAVLEYVETLQELDTQAVPPMSHVLTLKNVWRDDRPRKSQTSKSILSNAPEGQEDYFKVPKILEG